MYIDDERAAQTSRGRAFVGQISLLNHSSHYSTSTTLHYYTIACCERAHIYTFYGRAMRSLLYMRSCVLCAFAIIMINTRYTREY